MFDAIEAINDIIDDINDDVAEYAESCYEDIYEELCYRVECGELSVEEAELINEKAYDMYCEKAGYGDLKKKVRTVKKEVHSSLKKARKMGKTDPEGAISELENVKNNLETLYDEIKSTPDNVVAEIGYEVKDLLTICGAHVAITGITKYANNEKFYDFDKEDIERTAGRIGAQSALNTVGHGIVRGVNKASLGTASIEKGAMLRQIKSRIRFINNMIKKFRRKIK